MPRTLPAILVSLLAVACSSTGSDAAEPRSTEPEPTSTAPAPASSATTVATPAPTTTTPAPTASAAPAGDAKGVCDPAGAAAAVAAYESALPFLTKQRNEGHPSKEEWDAGMAALLKAAEAGLLAAQFDYGRTLYSVRFQDHAPGPKDEADYVRAFTFLRTAAMRGHAEAKAGFPDLAQAKVPATIAEPLKKIPRAWITKAYAAADEWLKKCPAKT